VSDIANASGEQSTGIEQINKALAQMDEVTQQNSALVEENAATAKTLEHQAKLMDERVAIFRLRGGANDVQSAQSAITNDRQDTAVAEAPRRPIPTRPTVEPKRQPVAAPNQAAVGGPARRMAAISGS
jgi:methyl-accepting chemotaxis protein